MYDFKRCFFLLRVINFSIAAKVYLPKCHRSSGSVADMWIKVCELRTYLLSPLTVLSLLLFWTFYLSIISTKHTGKRAGGKF
jgi:hypothetical protein